MKPTLARMKREIIEDLFESARNDSAFLKSIIQDLVSKIPDKDIPKAWEDADLGQRK